MMLLALALSAPTSTHQRNLTDAELVRLAAAPYDKAEKSGKSEILGLLRGGLVVADYPCGDICPNYTTRIIHYKVGPGLECATLGGVADTRGFVLGVGATFGVYCVPRALASKQPSPAEVCGISGVRDTAGGIALMFSDGRWFVVTHLSRSKGYLVGPKKEGDPFAKDTHPELNVYVGDKGQTRHTIFDTCHVEVVPVGKALGLQITSRYDASGSRMAPIEAHQTLTAEHGDSGTL